MKRKYLLALPLVFFTCSCNLSIFNLTDFRDPNLLKAILISDERKKEIIDDTHNYQLDNYACIDSKDIKKADYLKYMQDKPDLLMESEFYSFDDKILKFKCGDSRGEISKTNNGYSHSGNYYEDFGEYLTTDFDDTMFQFYGNNAVFSFGIIEEFNRLVSMSNRQTNTLVTLNKNISDTKWFRKVYLKSDEGEGNFTIGLRGSIKIDMNVGLNIFDEIEKQIGEDVSEIKEIIGDEFRIDGKYKYDFFELHYTNYRLDYALYNAVGTVVFHFGKIFRLKQKIHNLYYHKLTYNVDAEEF